MSLCVFEGLLVLFDRSKAPVYAIVLLPTLCIMLAVSWSAALGWVWKRPWLLRLTAVTLTIGLGLILVGEGISAYRTDQQRAQGVSRYLDVGRKIDSYLSPGARVLGSDRWWWALAIILSCLLAACYPNGKMPVFITDPRSSLPIRLRQPRSISSS